MVRRIMAAGGGVVVRDENLPELGPGDVLVRAAYSVVSPGTERSIVRATEISVSAAHEYPAPAQEWRQVRSCGRPPLQMRVRFWPSGRGLRP